MIPGAGGHDCITSHRSEFYYLNCCVEYPEHARSRMGKKATKVLAGWLKALAGKVAAALPGIIGAIISGF